MKLNIPYMKRVNYPKGPVPFDQYLPLKLRSYVSGKGQKVNDVACVQEMFVLFSCLKKQEFSNGSCSEEIKNLNKCYTNYLDDNKKRNEFMRSGVPQPGAKKLNHMQINNILKKFPT